MPLPARQVQTTLASSSRGRAHANRSPGQTSRRSPQGLRPHPSGPKGPGVVRLLVGGLALAALATVLVRLGGSTLLPLAGIRQEGPACPEVVNRWANQRLSALRDQLRQEHGLYRTENANLNAITGAMNWIDDRIIDQHISEERRQLRSSVLHSARCVPRFSL